MNFRAVWPAWFHCKEQIDNSVGGAAASYDLHGICGVCGLYTDRNDKKKDFQHDLWREKKRFQEYMRKNREET